MPATIRTAYDRHLADLKRQIGSCRLCLDAPRGRPLPHEPRPVLQASASARIAICGQAPGTRVHASGRPFTDPSGDRLRSWLGLEPDLFYDAGRIAIVPMGFCFPGLDDGGGDRPPRRECAPRWRQAVFDCLPELRLVIAVGMYAQTWHLGTNAGRTLTDTVQDWRSVLASSGAPKVFPLPHPSWRNNAWIKRNPWFTTDLLPVLQREVGGALAIA